jgi:hypothetical protein
MTVAFRIALGIAIVPVLACVHWAALAQGDAKDVTNQAEITRQTREFEARLESLGVSGRLTCELMIELIQQTRDRSFGAVCELRNVGSSRILMMCDDTMVGKFTLKASGFAIARDELVAFTKSNCPGGG